MDEPLEHSDSVRHALIGRLVVGLFVAVVVFTVLNSLERAAVALERLADKALDPEELELELEARPRPRSWKAARRATAAPPEAAKPEGEGEPAPA